MKAQLITNDTIALMFEYDHRIVSIVKQIPGRAFQPKARLWTFTVDGNIHSNLTLLQSAGFELDDKLKAMCVSGTDTHNTPLLEPYMMSSHDGSMQLRPYQAIKAAEAISRRGGLIRGFCGCGKTAISLAVMQGLECKSVLVVCPKSVLINWQREVKMWLGDDAVVVTGTPKERRAVYAAHTTPKYLIVTYDTLRIDIGYLGSKIWDAVLFDEAHYLVSTTSQRHKAAKTLSAKYKYALTATPVMNSATDIYGLMKCINKDLGNYYTFIQRYCEKDPWGSVKYFKHMDELAQRIKPWTVPVDLSDAQFQLPERTDTDLEFELSDSESSLYTRIKSELLFELESFEVSKLISPVIIQNTLTKLGKLQELTDSCELLGDTQISSKLEILKEHLENNLNDQKAIIFTRFARMAEILARELAQYNPAVLTGSTNNRQELLDDFTQCADRRIFISTEAGNAGINLQAASIVYNYDLPFSLGKLEQRMGRIRWHQQDRPVFFYNLIAKLKGGKGTIDGWVKQKIINKQDISDKLLMSDIKEVLK